MRIGEPVVPFNRTVTDDQSVLCYAKWVGEQTGGGVEPTAATIEVQANLLDFQVNGAAEVGIGTYTGNSGADNQIVFADTNVATVNELVRAINGRAPGQPAGLNRWRANLADFRPQFTLSTGDGLAAAAANAMLGLHHAGLTVLADSSALPSANTLSIGIGQGNSRMGSGPVIPDHFESDYTSTTAGVITRVRNPERRRVEGASVRFAVRVTSVIVSAQFATTKVLTIYDEDGNILWGESLTAAATATSNISPERYVEGPVGSPLWLEVTGTGAFTDGNFAVSGFVRYI